MAEKSLKRFEKLENIQAENYIKEGMQISRRFEHLEVGNKRISIAITDTVSVEEKAAEELKYWVICPYCGAENTADSQSCILCKHKIRARPAEETQASAALMKKCAVCGTVNQQTRRICWLCGKSLFEDANASANDKSNTNTIILNIDNKEYRSTDENLPYDVKELIERIRREGYSQRLIDEWVKQKQEQARQKAQDLEYRISDLRIQIRDRSTQLVIGIFILMIYLIIRYVLIK